MASENTTSPLGPIAGALGSVAGSAISSATQAKIAKRQIEATKQAHALQRSEALADREHDEFYNSPAMQRIRAEQAGLSPQEYVDPVSTSSDGAVPDYSSGLDSAYSNLAGAGASASQIAPSAINAFLAASQIQKNNADTLSSLEDSKGKELQRTFLDATFEDRVAEQRYRTQYAGQSIDLLGNQIELALSQKGLTDAQKNKLVAETEILNDTKQYAVALAKYEAENSLADKKIKDYQLQELLPSELNLNLSKLANDRSYRAQASAQIGYLVSLTTGQQFANERSSFENVAFERNFEKYVQAIEDKYNMTHFEAQHQCASYWIQQSTSMLNTAIRGAVSVMGVRTLLGAGKAASALAGYALTPLGPITAGTMSVQPNMPNWTGSLGM